MADETSTASGGAPRPRVSRPWLSATLILVVLFVGVNVLAGLALRGMRIDLTEEKLYTLSSSTREVLGGLADPISVRLYATDDVVGSDPRLAAFDRRVRELLAEYAARAGGKLRIEMVDAEPDSVAAEEAEAARLTGAPTREGVLYLGIVGTDALDGRQTLDLVQMLRQQDGERFLEYELTKLIDRLANPSRKVVGIMAGLPVDGAPDFTGRTPGTPAWQVVSELRALYEVRTVEPTATEIDAGLDLLLVIHPKSPGAETVAAIERFALSGRPVIVCVDPFSVLDPAGQGNPMMGSMPDAASDLPGLLAHWGVTYDASAVVGDPAYAERGPGADGAEAAYLQLMSPTSASMSADDPVMQGIGTLRMFAPGGLRHDGAKGTSFTPLVSTTDTAGTLDAFLLRLGGDPAALARSFEPSGSSYALAARITGVVSARDAAAEPDGESAEGSADDAGAAGPPSPDDAAASDDAAAGAAPAPTTGEINVIVMADVDFLSERLWGVSSAGFLFQEFDNPVLLLNAVDNMTGSTALSRLRARGTRDRPFTLIQRLQREADELYRAELEKLETRRDEVQERITALQQARTDEGPRFVATPEQRAELDRLEAEAVRVSGELRRLRFDLRKDREAVERNVKLVNILGMPLLVGVFALALAGARGLRRRADRRSLAGEG